MFFQIVILTPDDDNQLGVDDDMSMVLMQLLMNMVVLTIMMFIKKILKWLHVTK